MNQSNYMHVVKNYPNLLFKEHGSWLGKPRYKLSYLQKTYGYLIFDPSANSYIFLIENNTIYLDRSQLDFTLDMIDSFNKEI